MIMVENWSGKSGKHFLGKCKMRFWRLGTVQPVNFSITSAAQVLLKVVSTVLIMTLHTTSTRGARTMKLPGNNISSSILNKVHRSVYDSINDLTHSSIMFSVSDILSDSPWRVLLDSFKTTINEDLNK